MTRQNNNLPERETAWIMGDHCLGNSGSHNERCIYALSILGCILVSMDVYAEACSLLTRPLKNRGYWRLLQLSSSRGHRIRRVDSAEILYEAGDRYWAVLRANSFAYEPEIKSALRRLASLNFGFVDAGANIGFWSSWIQKELQVHRLVSIEPNPEVFSLLRINNLLNGGNAICLEAALTTSDSDFVTLFVPKVSGGHASGSLLSDSDSQTIHVSGVTLRSVIQTYMEEAEYIIIKLDVEGLESELLQVVADSRDKRQIVIYEEHGSDGDCLATETALKMSGYSVFFLEKHGNWIPIQAAHEVRALKTNPSVGYNCIAIPHALASHALSA